MRTIGKRWPIGAPKGDFQSTCDYCGATWRRSELRRDQAGRLYCPDEGDGKDAVTLDRENQLAMSRRPRGKRPIDSFNKNRLSS